MSGFNLEQLLEQARGLQEQLVRKQEALAQRTVTGESGGGMVKVVVNGHFEIVSLTLDPLCVDNRDVKMLEDLIRMATNKAFAELRALIEREYRADFSLPGVPPGLGLGGGR
jgi:DNA-binding YbaB/EbfC family protein